MRRRHRGLPGACGRIRWSWGNFIGTDAGGEAVISGQRGGVGRCRSPATPTTPSAWTSAGARNVISGHSFEGISGGDGSDDLIEGTHRHRRGRDDRHRERGWDLRQQPRRRDQRDRAEAGNLVSGNLRAGIDVGDVIPGETIQGNLIGTDLAGTKALGNQFGVSINTSVGDGRSSANLIGDATSAARTSSRGDQVRHLDLHRLSRTSRPRPGTRSRATTSAPTSTARMPSRTPRTGSS